MNKLRHIPFSISSSSGYSEKNNGAELINLFVHMEEAGAKKNHILMNTEGVKKILQLPEVIYGMYEFKKEVYVATAKGLYKYIGDSSTVQDTGNFEKLGIVDFDRKVVFADNGNDLVVVGGNGYAWTPSTSTLKNMNTEDGWYLASMVAYMDGYFIFNRLETGEFFISKLYSTELNPIDWASAESAPDNTIGVMVSSRQLWLFGERTTEIWYDSGDPDFPFTRIAGAVEDIGLLNYKTLSNIKGSLFFVGNDFKVYATNGYTPSIISTPAVNKLLDKCDATLLNGFSFSNNGHWFYALHIDNKYTYVFDVTTAQWHRRESYTTGKWLIDGVINRNYTSDLIGYSGNTLYSLSIHNFTEDNTPIRREAISLPINNGVNRFILSEVQLDMETGFNKEAEVILQLSDDGCTTWSNNHYASAGKIGRYKQRVRWLRLGQHRDCSLKIVITAPIDIRILGLYARLR